MGCGDVISRSYPVVSFCISGTEPSGSATRGIVSDIAQGDIMNGVSR